MKPEVMVICPTWHDQAVSGSAVHARVSILIYISQPVHTCWFMVSEAAPDTYSANMHSLLTY